MQDEIKTLYTLFPDVIFQHQEKRQKNKDKQPNKDERCPPLQTKHFTHATDLDKRHQKSHNAITVFS